ncbi:hypothetical protein V1509DRAFT_216146 [Lipomyces kononenkoae]
MVTAASALSSPSNSTTTTTTSTVTQPLSTGVSSSASMSSSGTSSGHRRLSSASAQTAVAVLTSSSRDSSAVKGHLVLDSYLEVEATEDHDSIKNIPLEVADGYSTLSLSRTSAARHLLTIIWDDLPAWRRDNHFIRSGYRKETLSLWKCLQSLGYLHNESAQSYTVTR